MKKLPLLLVALSLSPLAASAEPTNVALTEATVLAGGVPARAVMDGGLADRTVVAQAGPGAVAPTVTASAATLTPRGAPPAAAPAATEEPGFFSKAWDFVKKPTFLVPVGTALAFGAMGFMIAGPLGALTGLAIGGLLGFIFTKAM